jgi:PAT family beta-lactamase induction signal transducer AmpG
LAFVLFYKLADNFASALIRPFLVDLGYSSVDRGVALATMGLGAAMVGSLIGGVLTTAIGLGHSLWIFGFLQIFSNIGYVFMADAGVNRPLMYTAVGIEHVTGAMGATAFLVLLLRITEKRFSATQYALFSSVFAFPRIFSGPAAGFLVHEFGWKSFFWLSLVVGIPGLVLLQRFAPLGVREPAIEEK